MIDDGIWMTVLTATTTTNLYTLVSYTNTLSTYIRSPQGLTPPQ